MLRYAVPILGLLVAPGLVAQEPIKKIDDGVLDRIELYVPAIEHVSDLTAVIKPFDATAADLGTGGRGGKDARQDEAKTMQEEGPRVTGSVKDASGRVLATFTQRRAGAMGMGGGDSLGKLMTDARKIGEDIAKFLSKWARGDDLDG